MNAIKTLLLPFVAAVFMLPASGQNLQKRIIATERVKVDCPVGTAPRLPFRLWVKYSDGSTGYRQVRWENSPLESERAETAAEVGGEYNVEGYITGDYTTSEGLPVKALVKVVDGTYATPAKTPRAHTLPLSDVRITGDNRLTHNRNLDIANLLSLDVSQQLYNYRDTYGLSTEGYTVSDGWDSPVTKLKGHGTGHYLSALAFAYACAEDPVQKAQLKANITRMVNEMRECQERTFVWSDSLGRYWEARDFCPEEELREIKGSWKDFDAYKKDYRKYGYGYMNAIPAQHPAMVEMYRPYNNSDWVWAPYYTIHKQLAGLIDIATYMDDKAVADKALQIAKDMGMWVWNRMHYRTFVSSEGDREQRRSRPGNRYEMWNIYIAGENGGMGESMARLAEMTSDPTEKAKFIEGAAAFDNPVFFDALSVNVDDIRTRHANQHIPQIVGALRSYLTNGNPYYYNLALNFWRMIQDRYRYAPGGVGNGEMFRQPYTQMLSMGDLADLNETCCAYNLAKLTKDLACFDPDDASYMDYYERVLYNQIVGSINPEEYAVCYQYAVGLNATKPFGNETPQSTCCGGTGAENHVKYQEAIYFADAGTLWVALYMPSELNWKEKKVVVKQECEWPSEYSKITVSGGRFAMKLRVPEWATDGFEIKLNGKTIAKDCHPGTYFEIGRRKWRSGDVVEVFMPFSVRVDYGPDKIETAKGWEGNELEPAWAGTLMYGPLAMTGTGVQNWEDAVISLSKVVACGHSSENGYNGNVYSLKVDGEEFLPDYFRNEKSTHYYRIEPQGGWNSGADNGPVNKSRLLASLQVARGRLDAQKAWDAMATKVPEYAPWAARGFERMLEALKRAEDVYSDGSKTFGQREVNSATGQLNTAINSMRPGNLAEPEDLEPLFETMWEIGRNPQDPAMREAFEYARMVIGYVRDGSGTPDMIRKAIDGINAVK